MVKKHHKKLNTFNYALNSCIHKGYNNKYAYQFSNYTGLLKSQTNIYWDNQNSYQVCYK